MAGGFNDLFPSLNEATPEPSQIEKASERASLLLHSLLAVLRGRPAVIAAAVITGLTPVTSSAVTEVQELNESLHNRVQFDYQLLTQKFINAAFPLLQRQAPEEELLALTHDFTADGGNPDVVLLELLAFVASDGAQTIMSKDQLLAWIEENQPQLNRCAARALANHV